MTRILENLFSRRTSTVANSHSVINIARSRKAIGKIISDAYQKGNVVGVYCPAFGDGMLLVGIESILTDNSEDVIVLRPYDLNGILLRRTHIAISEIKSVCPFSCKYENPLLKKEAQLA